MAISHDPTLDVSALGSAGSIEQIPYTKLPFPFDDSTNAAQPGRTLYYPDDSPSMQANLNAHYAGSTQPQHVHTDGNHALLVSDVGGGGGFGAPANDWEWYGGINANATHNDQLYGPASALYRVECTITPCSAPVANAHVSVIIYSPAGGNGFIVAHPVFRLNSGGVASALIPLSYMYLFPGGLDLSALAPLGASTGIRISTVGISAGVALHVSYS